MNEFKFLILYSIVRFVVRLFFLFGILIRFRQTRGQIANFVRGKVKVNSFNRTGHRMERSDLFE